jgi:hypothetical protein
MRLNIYLLVVVIETKPNTINTGHVLATYYTTYITILCQVGYCWPRFTIVWNITIRLSILYHMQYQSVQQKQVYSQQNLSSEQRALIKTRTIQSMSITRVLKLLLVRYVTFSPHSTLIPEELELEVAHTFHYYLTPVVYSHFLRCLCY